MYHYNSSKRGGGEQGDNSSWSYTPRKKEQESSKWGYTPIEQNNEKSYTSVLRDDSISLKGSYTPVLRNSSFSIPDIPYKEKTGFFDYESFERTIAVYQHEQTIQLLNPEDIEPYMGRYKYVHIGLVQIIFKPLNIQGLNTSLTAYLYDARCSSWTQSLKGSIMKTRLTTSCFNYPNIADKPVCFDVYPNLSLSLKKANIFEAMSLNIKTQGYKFVPKSKEIQVIYRIHFDTWNIFAPKLSPCSLIMDWRSKKKYLQPTEAEGQSNTYKEASEDNISLLGTIIERSADAKNKGKKQL